MKKEPAKESVDSYIAGFPEESQKMLRQIRAVIKKAVPKAEEVMSYHMPAYKYHGMVAYFAGFKNHIGFYPMPGPITKFKKELSKYKTSKATVQFPIGEPVPSGLVNKIIKWRVQENLRKVKDKKLKI